MDLILTVEECPSHSNLLNHTKVFYASGGMVGRSENCDWVLTDTERVVSSKHFEVRYSAGKYYLIDHSTNGTFINDNSNPVGSGKEYELIMGDEIICGDYRLRAKLNLPEQAGVPPDLGNVDFLDTADRTTFNAGMRQKQEHANSLQGLESWLAPKQTENKPFDDSWGASVHDEALFFKEEVENDPLKLLTGGGTSLAANASAEKDWWGSDSSYSDQSNLYQRSMPVPAMKKAVDIDALLGIDSVIDKPEPPLQKVGIPSKSDISTSVEVPANSSLVNELINALGLEGLSTNQEQALVQEVSGMLNETLAHLIELLRARTTVKNELRVQHTLIQSVNNNPLKFSGNATEALRMLFSGGVSSFLRPVEAIKDGFEDLSDHQFAVLKATQKSYEYMLQQFDPFELSQKMRSSSSLWGSADAKKWKAYEQYYSSLKADYEETYSRLFGEAFAKEYEKIIADLKNRRLMG